MSTILVLSLASLLLPPTHQLAGALDVSYGSVDIQEVSLVLVAAFASLFLFEYLGMRPSVTLAVLGAFEAQAVLAERVDSFDWTLMLSWVVAPVVAGVVAALLYLLLRKFVFSRHIHLIKLSGYMRYVVIVGLVLLVLAVGMNNGALLLYVAELTTGGFNEVLAVVLLILLFCGVEMITGRLFGRQLDIESEQYSNTSTQTIVSVCYAAVVTLLVFSSSRITGLVGLQETPVGLWSLVMGGFCGVGLVRPSQMLASIRVGRAFAGVVLTPIVAILCYYLLSSLFASGEEIMEVLNISLLVFSLFLAMLVLFVRYVRKQERLHEASRKLIRNQQQQLYENQKAINAMELNTILAENQSLHGTLELKRKEIINVALGISEQKEFLEMLAAKVHKAAKSLGEEKDRLIAEVEKELSQRTSFSGEIDEFYTQAEMLHKDFSVKLTEEFPNLTTSERRLATLLRLGFSSKYIATLMNISPKSVEISRYRLRQKLGLKKGDNLINFIKSI